MLLGLCLTDLLVKLMNGSISVTSDGSHGSTFRVHVMLRSYSGSPVQRTEEVAVTVLAGKRVLVLAASGANCEAFANLLPTVRATVSCMGVLHGSDTPPAAVTVELLEKTDILVAELSLIPALEAMQARRSTKGSLLVIVALTTPLQYGYARNASN